MIYDEPMRDGESRTCPKCGGMITYDLHYDGVRCQCWKKENSLSEKGKEEIQPKPLQSGRILDLKDKPMSHEDVILREEA